MSVFAVDPSRLSPWVNDVISYFNGGTDSIKNCSDKFVEQIEALVQPNVWTGAAAKQNYNDFLATHQSLISFTNAFGECFSNEMNGLKNDVRELEVGNLGSGTNWAGIDNFKFEAINNLSEQNINVEVVTYDYNQIIEIGESLKSIKISLDDINTTLDGKLLEVNNESGMWDGDRAQYTQEQLRSILKENMETITSNLDRCISNIRTAAQNAAAADSTAA